MKHHKKQQELWRDDHSCGLWVVWNATSYIQGCLVRGREKGSPLHIPQNLESTVLLRLLALVHYEKCIRDRVDEVHSQVVAALGGEVEAVQRVLQDLRPRAAQGGSKKSKRDGGDLG